ncbi:MAG: Gfo/Idh/MocA family oxidoreductase [Candidatus Obscuribacterales bacterium]|nr:Gfo/Idh/MocA family oxidoreductase [Candidatus Obscuribacterales bacterium]
MIAVLGSGFGLYGYLPAIVGGLNKRVVLPERYRERVNARADVLPFTHGIDWCHDDYEALDAADTVIIAKRPEEQSLWVSESLKRPNIKRVLLEKPIAPSPEVAQEIIRTLNNSGKIYRIGYNFRFTNWFGEFKNWHENHQASSAKLTIDWRFRAHHYANNLSNWKRFKSAGGGVISFYGIHLIALLSEHGYDTVNASEVAGQSLEDSDKWFLEITNGKSHCQIFVDSNSEKECFSINADNGSFAVSLSDVFESQQLSTNTPGIDRRVDILKQVCLDMMDSNEKYYDWYGSSIDLWQEINSSTNLIQDSHWLTRRQLVLTTT